MSDNFSNSRTKYKYTMGNVFSSRVSEGLGWHSYYKPNIMRVITELEEMEKVKHTWIQDIDNHPNSTIFHTWEWVMNCIKNGLRRYAGFSRWGVYISFDENNKINFMMPTYEVEPDGDPSSNGHAPWTRDNKIAYLGMLYSDYTDPFCTTDDYYEFMNNSVIIGRGALKQMPNIRFPKGHRVSDEFSNICLYSYDCSDMKKKFVKDLRRQKKKLDNYSVFIDKGNKFNFWELFHEYWCDKWSEKWGEYDQEQFRLFVKDNNALNAAVLFIDNNPVAINLHTIHNGLCIFWVISRNPNIKFSAGTYLWYELMKTYENDTTVNVMSGGIGIENYKYNFFSKEEQLYATDWTNN